MAHAPTVATVMTPFPHAIEWAATVEAARAMMAEHAIRHLPVIRDSELVGVLRDDDLEAPRVANDTAIANLGLGDPYVVDIHARLDVVLDGMASRHCDSALVARRGRLAGIITIADVCTAFASHLREHFPPPDDVA